MKNHLVTTVGDAWEIAKKTRTSRHTARINCRCSACQECRRECGCTTPSRCYSKAKELLETLPMKWNPLIKQAEDYEPEELPVPVSEDTQIFDWHITTKGTLADAFRIFTDGKPSQITPTKQWNPDNDRRSITVYTNGSCICRRIQFN